MARHWGVKITAEEAAGVTDEASFVALVARALERAQP
jgi:hypothetical protein